MTAAPRLSLCMIVRDEAANLPACLESVRGVADEIVIIDTGSRDATIAIARAHGAKVAEITWPGDFSVARNTALDAASGDWILVLDADETLPEASRPLIRKLVEAPADRAHNLIQKNRLSGGASHVAVRIVRLFPRDARVRFERAIHEQVNTSLERAGIPIVDTDVTFDHSGYAEAGVLAGKTERNRRIIEAELQREPDGDPHLRYFYASTFFDLKQFERAAKEFADCARRCEKSGRPKLAASSRIKAAQSYVLSGDLTSAATLLPEKPTEGMHPLAAHLKAEVLTNSGKPFDAVVWQEAVLAAADTAYLPPEPLAPLKFKALLFLANAWAAKGRKDIGVKLLRLAQEISSGQRDGSSAEVGKAYRLAVAG